jgi:hypothetical protein
MQKQSTNTISQKDLTREIYMREKQIADLYVVIDTLQTNLESAFSRLSDEQKKEIQTPSFKWCMNWSQGDEKS